MEREIIESNDSIQIEEQKTPEIVKIDESE